MPRPLLAAVLVVVAVLAAACSQPSAEVSSARSAPTAVPSATPAPVVTPTPDVTATPAPAAPTPSATATPAPVATDAPGHAGHEQDADAAHGGAAPRMTTPSGGLPTADELIEATRIHLEQWRDVGAAEAAGFRSIGDAFTGWEHLVQPEWAADGVILDPAHPESLVYRVDGEQRELVSAMYLLPPGATMADVPDLGDERAAWHIHDDLCFDEEGRLAGVFRDGECLFGGEHRVTAPMMHVWIVEHPCGPFAAIEGHGDVCDTAHDH